MYVCMYIIYIENKERRKRQKEKEKRNNERETDKMLISEGW